MNLRPWLAKHFGPECAYEHLAAEAARMAILQVNGPGDVDASRGPDHKGTSRGQHQR